MKRLVSKASRAIKIIKTTLSRSFVTSPSGYHACWVQDYGDEVRKLKHRFEGEDCFLLCNGPSLNKVDFTQLKDKHIIGLNKIHLLFDKHPLDLSLHVVVNTLVIDQCHQNFHQLDCPSFWAMNQTKRHIPLGKNTIPLVTRGAGEWGQGFAIDMLRDPVEHGNTVTFAALQILYSLGFRNVFIVGMDHNFATKGEANKREVMKGSDENHFHPGYFSGMQWDLPDLEGSELNYRNAEFVYRRSGRGVYDATEGGKCDIFPKMSFEDAVTSAKPKNS